jgi:hypothetical protein
MSTMITMITSNVANTSPTVLAELNRAVRYRLALFAGPGSATG